MGTSADANRLAWKAYLAQAKNLGPESAFNGGFEAGKKSNPTSVRDRNANERFSFREKLARAIFYAAPPANPHGPDSDLDFGDNYVKWETERAYRIADGLIASGVLN